MPPARIGRIITPGENHHSDRCAAATPIAMIATASPKAIRRFRVMNCRLTTARSRCPRARRARRARCEKRAGRETMMAALYP